MNTIDIMDCGEIICEYCSKDKCVYMTDNEVESGDETPDEYARKDGEGCICNGKQLSKMFRENEEAWMREAKILVRDWEPLILLEKIGY